MSTPVCHFLVHEFQDPNLLLEEILIFDFDLFVYDSPNLSPFCGILLIPIEHNSLIRV